MRKRSHHQARLRARSSRQQELPFPMNVFHVLKDEYYLMAHRPALEHLLAALLKSSEDAVLTVSPAGMIETWSAGAERLYGYTTGEMIGQSVTRLLPVYESPQLESLLSKIDGDGKPVELGERLHKNGSRILLAIRRSVIRGDNGEAEGILEIAQALDTQEAFWSPEEAPLRLLMEQVPGLLWTTDKNLRILTHWGSGLPAAKIRQPSLKGQNVREFLGVANPHATPIAEHYSALRGVVSHLEYACKGSVLEIRLGPLRSASGEIIGCLGAAVDITERKKSEQQALYQARHDGLTGLANYREFMDRLECEVRRAERSHRSFTLLLLDLDELKRINDLHGHLAGNRALRRLAAVMNEHCRSTDLAARYGGDEFAAVLIDSDRGMAENVAQRIEQRLRSDPEKPALSVSIGIGVYPDDGRSPAELIEAADQHLYRRKKSQNQRTVAAP
jgi:diguanylate cyclase (GGDEF)-like protein/PAS domain S-box-containing protein